MRMRNEKFYETSSRPVKVRACDHPACGQAGDFRAPKSRDAINEYYFFCLDHVREYNKAWDYFAGLSPEEVEAYTRDATVWERPSWPIGQWGAKERQLRDKAMEFIFGDAPQGATEAPSSSMPMPTAEREALTIMELVAPVDFTTIKNQYRTLVKKHHPDLHGGAREAEEKFKNINQAFTVLRQIYEPAAEGA